MIKAKSVRPRHNYVKFSDSFVTRSGVKFSDNGFALQSGGPRRVGDFAEPALAQARQNRQNPCGYKTLAVESVEIAECGRAASPLPRWRRDDSRDPDRLTPAATAHPGAGRRAQPRHRRKAAKAASAEPSTTSEPGSGIGGESPQRLSLQSNGK
jgi:hypothetical protein